MILQRYAVSVVLITGLWGSAGNVLCSEVPLGSTASLAGTSAMVQMVATESSAVRESICNYGYIKTLTRIFALDALKSDFGAFQAWLRALRAYVDRKVGTSNEMMTARVLLYYMVDYIVHSCEKSQKEYIGSVVPDGQYKSAAVSGIREFLLFPLMCTLGNVCMPSQYVAECVAIAPIIRASVDEIRSAL